MAGKFPGMAGRCWEPPQEELAMAWVCIADPVTGLVDTSALVKSKTPCAMPHVLEGLWHEEGVSSGADLGLPSLINPDGINSAASDKPPGGAGQEPWKAQSGRTWPSTMRKMGHMPGGNLMLALAAQTAHLHPNVSLISHRPPTSKPRPVWLRRCPASGRPPQPTGRNQPWD